MRDAVVFSMLVQEIDALSDTVRRLVLRPDDGAAAMSYREGQFLSIRLPGGGFRSYSMAGPCRADGLIELHVRLQPGGEFSSLLAEKLKPGDVLQVLGPFGDCVLEPTAGPGRTTVILATGTGAAPIKAMIERLFIDGEDRPVSFYWGGCGAADLYLSGYFESVQKLRSGFRYIPVLAAPDDGWPGRQGFVQEVAAADFPSLRSAVVYACGAPVMVEAARRLLTEQRALPPANFRADPFEPSTSGLSAGSGAIRLLVSSSDGVQTEVTGRIGATLLETLRGAGLPVHGVCGGKKACGACRVRIDPPAPPEDRDELRLLAALDAGHPGDRLSCQLRLHAGHGGARVLLPASPF